MPYLPKMKKAVYILLFLLLAVSGCSRHERIKGVHVRLQEAEIRQRYGGEMGALADEIKAAGINLVVTPVLEDGTAFYPSDVLPQRWEYGTQLLAFRHELRRRNIRFAASVPVFSDAYTYRTRPDLRAVNDFGSRTDPNGRHAICPRDPDYQDYKLGAIREILLILQPDVLYLSALSFPLDPEGYCDPQTAAAMRPYCFCSACRRDFSEQHDLVFPENLSTGEAASRILNDHKEAWTQWKCAIITDYVKALEQSVAGISPDCRIMLETPPWKEAEFDDGRRRLAGHDLNALEDPVDDFVFPLCSGSGDHEQKRLSEISSEIQKGEHSFIPSININAGDKDRKAFSEYLAYFKNNIIIYGWTSLIGEKTYLNIFSTEF